MIRLEPIGEKEFASCLPMIESWCANHEKTKDSFMDGGLYNVRKVVIEERTDHGIEYLSIIDDVPIGIVGHIEKEKSLDGVVLWLEPDRRCEHLLPQIFDALADLARGRGKTSIKFTSKVWGKSPLLLGFKLEEILRDGDDAVYTWQRLT